MKASRLPSFLRSDVFPYTSVAIVHVDGTVTELVRPVRPVVEVRIVPKDRAAFEAAIVDVELEPVDDEDAPYEEDPGSQCGSWCGGCGRCS
jgi:hypothetical protein